MKRRPSPTYNILFPIWFLVWLPSPLWILLIPANYLIDLLVLRWTLPKEPDRSTFCSQHTWKVCLAGFVGDFVGSLILFTAMMALDALDADLASNAAYGLGMNPFANVISLLVTLAAIAFSSLIIYLLDRRILVRTELSPEQARFSALRLAVITAPYLFLVPSALLYQW